MAALGNDFASTASSVDPLPSEIQSSLAPMDISQGEKKIKIETHEIPKQQELRVEVQQGDSITLTLIKGDVEIFGTELVTDEPIQFSGDSFPLFSWHSASVKIEGECHTYIAEDTPMTFYTNTHDALEQLRNEALEKKVSGPRILLAGATDTGKSSVSRLLLSYAARCGRTPLFIDLDVGQGSITVPGMLGAILVQRPYDLQNGWARVAPLVQFFGNITPSKNLDMYKKQCSSLAKKVEKRVTLSDEVNASGMVINTCGMIHGEGFQLLQHAIKEFQATVVLVLGNERLYADLKRNVNNNVLVVNAPKSGGVVTRSPQHRRQARDLKFKEYFYGMDGKLNPLSRASKFSEIAILEVGGGPQAPSSALPIGAERVLNPCELIPVLPTTELVHSVLAVSHAQTREEVDEANIAGFVKVTEVRGNRSQVIFLAPCPGPLPGRFLLKGNLRWLGE